MTTINTFISDKWLLRLSVLSLVYFSMLIVLSYHIDVTYDIQSVLAVFSELLTLPFLLLLSSLLWFSLCRCCSKKIKLKTISFISLILIVVQVAILVFYTVYDFEN